MRTELVTDGDIKTWLGLAAEVEPLFGPMTGEESFRRAVATTIAEGEAYCIRVRDGLAGVIAISRRENAVEWLAVAAAERGKGCGRALLDFALATLDKTRPVTVQTFAAECAAGAAARQLYIRAGFAEVGKAGLNPAGVPTVIMRRPPDGTGSGKGVEGLELERWVAGEVHRYYWQDDINCATVMLTILAELAGVCLSPQTKAAAAGLHGAGGYGAQCGLVEGALMYIGIAAGGRGLPAGKTAVLCRDYAAAFTTRFGSLLCRELRPEGFSPDNPPHLCEKRTVDAIIFAIGFMRGKGLTCRVRTTSNFHVEV